MLLIPCLAELDTQYGEHAISVCRLLSLLRSLLAL